MARKSVFWLSAAFVVASLGFLSSETASAAWNPGFGNQRSGYGYQSYRHSGYGHQNRGFYPNNGYTRPGFSNRSRYQGGHFDYHDTTHFDYQRPTNTRHGNHLDRTPGHFDVHRSGHYDRH